MLEFEALLRSYADRVEGYLHSCFTDADEPQQVLERDTAVHIYEDIDNK